MAFGSGRLPKRYVLACLEDPAIDWFGSAEAVGVDPQAEELVKLTDDKQRIANIEAEASIKYANMGAVQTMPLVAKTGQKITEFYCRAMTKDEYADVSGYLGNIHRLRLEVLRCVLLDVKNWADEEPWKDVNDLPQVVIDGVGSALYIMNRTSGEVRDFS